MQFPTQIAAGFSLAAVIAALAQRLRLLTASGALAAAFVGGCVFGFGGWAASAPLLVFFATSNLLGRYKKAVKTARSMEKSGPRDAFQVLANGAVASGLIVCYAVHEWRSPILLVAFAASLAEANADTWATEIGSAVRGKAWNILTLSPVTPGRSGGVTLPGTLAALGGSFAIALVSMPLFHARHAHATVCLVALSGFLGSLIDSIIGASLQAGYRNNKGEYAESEIEGYRHVRGIHFIGNNAVNAIGTASAALIAMLLTLLS